MRNEMSVAIHTASTALGVGLLERAVELEGGKGCSPILCQDPVNLEPPYERFDSQHVLLGPWGGECAESHDANLLELQDGGQLSTFSIYAAPEDILDLPWMEGLLRALSVRELRVVFELSSGSREEQGKVNVRFAISPEEIPGLKLSIAGLFPAIRLKEEHEPFRSGAPAAVEEVIPVPPYHRTCSLLGNSGPSPLGIVAASIADLGPDDAGVYQVLLRPASPDHDWHFNVGNLVEAEKRARNLSVLGGLRSDFAYDATLPPLAEPSAAEKVQADVAFFAVVFRYAVWTSNFERERAFLQGMRSATGMLRFGNRAWRQLSHYQLVSNLGEAKVERMVTQRLTHRPGLMLTSRELASIVHIPNARNLKMFSHIAQRVGLEWTPLPGATEGSMTLGSNEYAGEVISVSLPLGTRLLHEFIVGTTGSGKSNLQKNQILEDISNGFGVGLIDPHSDLCMDVLARMPEERMSDLVFISFTEPGWMPQWNPFASDASSGKVADDIARAIAASTPNFGPRMAHNFRLLAYVVHRLGGTLHDLAELVGKTPYGEELRRRALESIDNAEVQRFLGEELPSYKASELDSVRNKLSRLLLDESLGAMFQQRENDVLPRRWMDEGRIVLVDLAAGRLGADNAHFAGGLLVSLIHRAALSRVNVAPEQRRPFLLYLEECQLLQTDTLAEALSEGRKYGLGLVLTHQEGGQLSVELTQALGNCGTRVVFRPAPDDTVRLRRSLLNRVTDEDLLRLRVGEAFVAIGDRVASLRTPLCTLPVLRDPRAAALAYAERHYARVPGVGDAVASIPGGRRRRPRTYDRIRGREDECEPTSRP